MPSRKSQPRKLSQRQVTTQQEVSKIASEAQGGVTSSSSNAIDPLSKLYQDLQSSKQVRMGIGEDGKPFVSAYDFINFVAGRNQFNDYGRIIWSRYMEESSKYSDELEMLTTSQKIGKKDIPCVKITGIFFIRLIT